jgi:hypothetical protein
MREEEQIINGVRYVKEIYEDSDLATQEQKNTWESVCQSCEYVQQDGTCGACGCIRETLMNLATSVCPEGKW